jgi:ribonuclease P protein component
LNGFGFPKARRVRKRADYVRVQASQHRATTKHFVFLFARGAEGAPWRAGVVVTRKLGGAVERNRIKRLCRECFRTERDWFPRGVDVVVIARAGAHLLSQSEVRTEWLAAKSQLERRATAALRAPPLDKDEK